MQQKSKFLIIFTSFLALFLFSNLASNSYDKSTDIQIEKEISENPQVPIIKLPSISSSDPFQKSNPFFPIDETFDNINDWAFVGLYVHDKQGSDWYIELGGNSGGGTSTADYTGTLNSFIHGNISFTFTLPIATGDNLYFEVSDSISGYTWVSLWSRTLVGTGTANIDLTSRDTDDVSFNFRLRYTHTGDGDVARIDNFKLGTYEFAVTETDGDPALPNQDQDLTIFICPSITSWNNDAAIQYKINSTDFTGVTPITSPDSQNNFSITIPQSAYTARDTVYYRIRITGSSTEYSYTFSFICRDIVAPTISAQLKNATTYYRDVLIRCNIADNSEGLGLKNVTMYIRNGTAAGKSDKLILSNRSSSIPWNGGNFGFTIPHIYLSARSNEQLHYRIYAIDKNDNEANSGDQVLSIGDDIKPSIMFNKAYKTISGIENNKSLIVSYKITEPCDASGLPLFMTAFLFVKINSTPSASNDFDFSVIPSNILTAEGGIFNFTISESYFDYNDYIYFFVNATDNNGNTNSTFDIGFSTYQKVYSNDTYAPWVVNWSSNDDTVSYNQTKTLTFTITEPNGASGIDNNTLVLYFEVDHWTDNNRKTIEKDFRKFGGDISFIINEDNYSYGDIIYYQLNVSDLAGNKFSSIIGSFYAGDLNAPTIAFIAYNNTSPQYFQDFNMTFRIWEDPDGSKFSKVELFVKNSTSSTWIRIYNTNRTSIFNLDGTLYVEFKVNSTILYARFLLEWRLDLRDIANNLRQLTNSIMIHDHVKPSIWYDSNNGTSDNFEYYQNARIYYNFQEPSKASGFNTGGTGLKLYYNNGTSINPNDYDGQYSLFETTIDAYGGTYSFVIPASVLVYNDIIWFWVNGSDLENNLNGTWNDRHYLRVIDLTKPIITLAALNNDSVSYHLDKTVYYTPTEPIDASLLKNATLYWRRNLIPTTLVYNGLVQWTISGSGGTQLSRILSHISLEFKYKDRIYFIIEIYDIAGNVKVSSVNVFNITDTVSPDYTEDAGNQNDWTWRINRELKFTIFDPNYANSSGISAITLYYRAGANPTTSVYDNRTIVSSGIITRASKTYTIVVYLNVTLYNKGPNIYYFVRIYDVEGRYRDSTVQSFRVYADVFDHNLVVGPKQGAWLDNGNIPFSFNLYFVTNLWILISEDETHYTVYNYTNSLIKYEGLIDFEEGSYIVKFSFLNNLSVQIFTFSVDLTAPSQISGVEISVYGFEVVEIVWKEPKGADSETTYKIYRSTEPNFKIGDDTLLAEILVGERLSYEDSDIEPSTTYYYKVIAIDRVGHVSKPSEAFEAKIPANPLIPIILVVVIGSVAGISAFVVKKKVSKNKTAKLLSQVNMDEIEKKYGQTDLKQKKSAGWTEIKTKAEYKPKVSSEIQFVEETPTDLPPTANAGAYWHERMAKLVGLGAEFELSNDYGKAIRVYSILTRISKRTRKAQMKQWFQEKQQNVYQENSK